MLERQELSKEEKGRGSLKFYSRFMKNNEEHSQNITLVLTFGIKSRLSRPFARTMIIRPSQHSGKGSRSDQDFTGLTPTVNVLSE